MASYELTYEAGSISFYLSMNLNAPRSLGTQHVALLNRIEVGLIA
mgnify:CR=1 FL=1